MFTIFRQLHKNLPGNKCNVK